ncbi:MAG: lysylphosphatidylglycerol synthase transmembrane domain-containing protein [Candidatus Binatia bacterium]
MHFLSSRWVQIGISLGLFALLFYIIDVGAFVQQLRGIRFEFFTLALIGYLLSQVFSGYKWQVLARPFGFLQPLRTFVVYYFVGMYLNLFAPSTVVGDVGRGVLLAANSGRTAAALHSVVADRASGFVMLLWVSTTGFFLFGARVLPPVLCWGVTAAAIAAVVGWWGLPRIVESLFMPQHIISRAVAKVIGPYRLQPAALGAACVISYIFHWFQLSLQVVLAHAVGLHVPFWYFVLFIPLVHIIGALPISFGGLGVREGGYVTFLALIGIGKDQALALGFLWSALVLLAGVIGGLVLLFSAEAKAVLTRTGQVSTPSC